jgi:hypothetical protein
MVICPTGKAENFFDQDWTGRNRLNRFDKFDFARRPGRSGLPRAN